MNRPFKKQHIFLITVLAVTLLWSDKSVAQEEVLASQLKVGSVRAFLFLSDKGVFSTVNLIDNSDINLWNTIIGKGEAGGSSTETLVIVEVQGQSGSYESGREVRIDVFAGKKNILKKTIPIGVLNGDGRCFAPFLIYDTGCSVLRIVAQITGQPASSKIEKKIDFECGE